MTGEPITWHYGLMAEHWANFNLATPELDFFQKAIARFGQPVLDVACGAGRLLVPLLQSGVDIDGIDLSPDMLEQTRRRAAADGLTPRLYCQPMHVLDLPRAYRTIYICGSFGLGSTRINDLIALRRCFDLLEPGGALIFNIDAEYADPNTWAQWTAAYRQSLPRSWPESGDSQIAPDGSIYTQRFRTVCIDPVDFNFTSQVRLEKHQYGQLVASEEHTLHGNVYFKPEVVLMLQIAGFRSISVCGDYADTPPTPDNKELVFIAVK